MVRRSISGDAQNSENHQDKHSRRGQNRYPSSDDSADIQDFTSHLKMAETVSGGRIVHNNKVWTLIGEKVLVVLFNDYLPYPKIINKFIAETRN